MNRCREVCSCSGEEIGDGLGFIRTRRREGKGRKGLRKRYARYSQVQRVVVTPWLSTVGESRFCARAGA